VAYRPFEKGTTVDFDVTARLIHGVFARTGLTGLSRARMMVSIPTLATAIERRAVRQACVQAGAKEVVLMEQPLAAAIGLGLPVEDPIGSAVTVLGAGVSEVAVISLGGIVTSAAQRLGGADLDAFIAAALRQTHGVVTAPATIEYLKMRLADARGEAPVGAERIMARGVMRGERRELMVNPSLVVGPTHDIVRSTTRMIQKCLSETPPDLSQDVARRGMYLVGGHAQVHGMATVISEFTGVTVTVPRSPEHVVIDGLRLCLRESRVPVSPLD
jgi:rod shape-determining protein MreB